jgi:hypothetical protein
VILPLLAPQVVLLLIAVTVAPLLLFTFIIEDVLIQLLASLIVTVYAPAANPVKILLT